MLTTGCLISGSVQKIASAGKGEARGAAVAVLPVGKRFRRLSESVAYIQMMALPVAKTPGESAAQNVLRKVKIGDIIASVVDTIGYERKAPYLDATECDETGEIGACLD